MITKIYNTAKAIAIAALFTIHYPLFVSCTDTWNDHYNGETSAVDGIYDGTLWQAVKADPQLSNFASVV